MWHGLDELLRNSKLKECGSYVEPETQPKFDSSELLIIRSEIPWHYWKEQIFLFRQNGFWNHPCSLIGFLDGWDKCHAQNQEQWCHGHPHVYYRRAAKLLTTRWANYGSLDCMIWKTQNWVCKTGMEPMRRKKKKPQKPPSIFSCRARNQDLRLWAITVKDKQLEIVNFTHKALNSIS